MSIGLQTIENALLKIFIECASEKFNEDCENKECKDASTALAVFIWKINCLTKTFNPDLKNVSIYVKFRELFEELVTCINSINDSNDCIETKLVFTKYKSIIESYSRRLARLTQKMSQDNHFLFSKG